MHEVFLFAGSVEVNSAFGLRCKVLRGEHAEVEEVEGEAVDQRMAEFFEQVEGEAGAAVFDAVVKSEIGIETRAVEQGLQLGADDGLQMAD